MVRSKKLCAVIVSLVVAVFLSGCGFTRGGTETNGNGSVSNGDAAPDTQAPAILPSGMADTLELGGSLVISYTVSDNVSTPENIYVDIIVLDNGGMNVTENVFNNVTKTFTPDKTGVYKIIIEAYDEAGNNDSFTYTVKVTAKEPDVEPKPEPPAPDTQKPNLTLGKIESTLELGGSVTLSYTVSDNVSEADKIVVEVKILNNGADVTSQSYNAEYKRFTPLEKGEYEIIVSARDEAGNIQLAKHTVNVVSALAAMPSDPRLPADQAWGADVSVHDPSVFYDAASKTYYAYGSHFAVAKSSDLVKWSFVSDTDTAIYGGPRTSVLTKAYGYVGGDINTWAPDVEYRNGKYYMYFSITSAFGSRKSVIGRVESDSPTGPFNKNETLLIKSGGNSGPNAIDPELFYDKNGGLWIVYGSFFDGIYVKELYNDGENWGLPKDDGLGTKVWQGTSDGPEGPYVFYNAETDYYYLMASYGSLSHNYNMNVARSRNPNGPYLDITGKNVAEVQKAGNKLAGNYKFKGASQYTALGHNSIAKTADGKYINIFHTRYALGTEANPGAHNLRSHQMFFNEYGWPVMSPARYAAEKTGRVTAQMAAGDYDLILHTSSKTADDIVNSELYTFSADDSVRKGGANAGSWELRGDYYISLTLNGTRFNGVITPSWCVYKNKAVFSITAVGDNGAALWANGM